MIELVHSVPGRLRVRIPWMRRDARAAAEIRSAVASIPALRTVATNIVTGSLVVTYDPSAQSVPELWNELQCRLGPGSAVPAALASGAVDARWEPGWIDDAIGAALRAIAGHLLERSALVLVRAVI